MHSWTIPLPSWVKRVLSECSPVAQAQVVQRVGEDRDDAVAVFKLREVPLEEHGLNPLQIWCNELRRC